MSCVGFLFVHDLFYVQTLRLRPELALRPFWVRLNDKVLAYSPILDSLGIRRGTPARQAAHIAPDAERIEYRPEDYQALHDLFCDIAYRFTPVVEPLHPGEIFLGLQEHSCTEISKALLAETRDLGFEGVMAVSGSRLVSRLLAKMLGVKAASSEPGDRASSRRQYIYLPPEEQAAFLASRPVQLLWTLPRKVRERIERLGMFRTSDLQRITGQTLQTKFGKDAHGIQAAIWGRDQEPLKALWPPESDCVEDRFEAIDNHEVLQSRLSGLSKRLSEKLKEKNRRCQRIRLEALEEGRILPLSGFMVLNPPASGANRIYLAAQRLTERLRIGSPIEHLKITAEDLSVTIPNQLDLFSPLKALQGQKEEFKAFLTLRFGSGTLRFCSELADGWREQMLGFYRIEGVK